VLALRRAPRARSLSAVFDGLGGASRVKRSEWWSAAWVLLVAILQIVGGLLGVWFMRDLLPSGGAMLRATVINFVVWLGFVLLFATSTVAGILLLRRHALGRMLSCVVQGAQLPIVSIGGFSYWFIVACAARVEIRWPDAETYFVWSSGSEAGLLMRSQAQPAVLGLNALAFFVLLSLAFPRGSVSR
jgi:hypothetical protein